MATNKNENVAEEVQQNSNNEGLLHTLEDTGSSGLGALKNAITAIGAAMTDLVEAASPTKKEADNSLNEANSITNVEEAHDYQDDSADVGEKSDKSTPAKSTDEFVELKIDDAGDVPTTSETTNKEPSSAEIPREEQVRTEEPVDGLNEESSTIIENDNGSAPVSENNDIRTPGNDYTNAEQEPIKEVETVDQRLPTNEEGAKSPETVMVAEEIKLLETENNATSTEATKADASSDEALEGNQVTQEVPQEAVPSSEAPQEAQQEPDVAPQEVIVSETTTSPLSLPVFIEIADGEKKTTVIEMSETVTRDGEEPILVDTKTIITTSVAEKSSESESADKPNTEDENTTDSVSKINDSSNEEDDEEGVILAEGELDNITLGDNEYIVGEVVEVDDNGSLDTVDSEGKPKKKKKLRLFKKIKRGTKAIVVDAPKAVAYGALFSAGALVGGSIVGSKAIGHGAVSGTKAIGHGVTSGAEAIGHGVQAIGRGTKELAKNAASTIADGSRAGAEFVTDTGEKIVVGTKEFAQSVADGTVKVAKGTKIIIVDSAEAVAYGALYGSGAVIGGTKAIGHGVVEGTVRIAEGTKNTADSFAKASAAAVGDIVDGAKSGAAAVSNTAARAKNAVEEKAREALLSALEATQAGAQFAGYGKDGKALAIEGAKTPKSF